MTTNSTTTVDETTLFVGDAWSDPIEAGVRDRIRDFIEERLDPRDATRGFLLCATWTSRHFLNVRCGQHLDAD